MCLCMCVYIYVCVCVIMGTNISRNKPWQNTLKMRLKDTEPDWQLSLSTSYGTPGIISTHTSCSLVI